MFGSTLGRIARAASALACVTLAAGACSSKADSDDSSEMSTTDGALECKTTPVECREAFADNYAGTYMGDAAGSVIVDIDVLGGIVGTATLVEGGSVALDGKVNEYGKVEITAEDGTTFEGQFSKDKQLTGTWKRTDGSKGTFSVVSTTAPVPTPGNSGPATSPNGTAGSPSPSQPSGTEPDDATLLAAAKTACMKIHGCEGAQQQDCTMLGDADLPPEGCRAQGLAVYECEAEAGCASGSACADQFNAALDCLIGGAASPMPTPAGPDPGTGFETTGTERYDEVVANTCSACKPEATACHDDDECLQYADCEASCADVPCLQRCLSRYDAGYQLWLAAADCRDQKCPQP